MSMTDLFKEIWEAASQRIRSPFLGSIVFAFVAINWRALFYLFFAETSVITRLTYFRMRTDLYTLYLAPLVVGLLLALAMPWLKFVGAWIAVKPAAKLAELQSGEASRRRIAELDLKTAEDEALERSREASERRKIKEQQRLSEAEEVGGKELASKISSDRAKEDTRDDPPKIAPEIALARKLNKIQRAALWVMGQTRQNEFNAASMRSSSEFQALLKKIGYTHSDARLIREFDVAIEGMVNLKILQTRDHAVFQVAAYGYKIFDALEVEYGDVLRANEA